MNISSFDLNIFFKLYLRLLWRKAIRFFRNLFSTDDSISTSFPCKAEHMYCLIDKMEDSENVFNVWYVILLRYVCYCVIIQKSQQSKNQNVNTSRRASQAVNNLSWIHILWSYLRAQRPDPRFLFVILAWILTLYMYI